ncbi:tetratricopeptide repeat protein [Solibacillus silvestris]|uniref:tetratricopeptide repeat protein n=1 Tax=Solibacillus silvestris TaxID=76853 RepID=UPI003F7F2119
MNEIDFLQQAVQLRSEGKLHESNELLIRLVEQHPNDTYIDYQCAWSFDMLGQESKAVQYYEKAILGHLNDEDLANAYLGLGSTYRALGEYGNSKHTFEQGLKQFPHNKAIQVFYAMTLFNLNEHERAMELLLKNIATTSSNPDIKKYKNAIAFYSDKLSEVWK